MSISFLTVSDKEIIAERSVFIKASIVKLCAQYNIFDFSTQRLDVNFLTYFRFFVFCFLMGTFIHTKIFILQYSNTKYFNTKIVYFDLFPLYFLFSFFLFQKAETVCGLPCSCEDRFIAWASILRYWRISSMFSIQLLAKPNGEICELRG
jgi:hypothetical protein